MSNLVPEVRVNKNGVPVTKHVKLSASPPARSVVPAPSLTADAPLIDTVRDALTGRLNRWDYRAYTGDRKSLILQRLNDVDSGMLEVFSSATYSGAATAEIALIELLDRGAPTVQADDILYLLSGSWGAVIEHSNEDLFNRGNDVWGKLIVDNAVELLQSVDAMNLKGIEYRFSESDRKPLREHDVVEIEKATLILELLTEGLRDGNGTLGLQQYGVPGKKVHRICVQAFERVLKYEGKYGKFKALNMLLSEYFDHALEYMEDDTHLDSIVDLLIASRETSWMIDYEAFNRMVDEGINSPSVMSDEAVDQVYTDVTNDLYHGRLVALAKAYPDNIEAIVSFIEDRGRVVPEGDSEAVKAYISHDVSALRNGTL